MLYPSVLAPFPMPDFAFERLSSVFAVRTDGPATTKSECLSTVAGLAVSTHGRVDATYMDALPKLEVIANLGVGYENIDAAEAARRGIQVTNTPDVLSDDVADLAVGLLLCAVRRLPQAACFVRESRWIDEGPFPLTSTLKGRRVGLLGYGRIGATIAQRLSVFPVEIVYCARASKSGVSYRYAESAQALAQMCDVMIVTVPGGSDTDNLVDADTLRALGSTGVLINVARGSVVDENALIEALNDGVIEAAGLDVFRTEPAVPEQLLVLDQVVALPHVGSATRHTREAMADLMIANLQAWFSEHRTLTPVRECVPLS